MTQTDVNASLNKTVLHIPVAVTILVPIELDEDVSGLDVVDNVGGCNVVDIMSDDTTAERLITLALEKAEGNEDVIEALSCLLQGIHIYKQGHPMTKAVYTPFMGVIKESEV